MKARPGTYALLLASTSTTSIDVGRLGPLPVERGFYVYVGTAFGPGGLAGRLAHHRRPARRPHWHIDYLRRVAILEEVWFTHDPDRREHAWAELLAGPMRGEIPLPRFGASDCRCAAHLFFFSRRPSARAFARRLHARHAGHARLHVARAGPPASNHRDRRVPRLR